MKKYFYTINHKRLGLNYFYFSLITALSGSLLATAIRFEMAYPGSPFFHGDSLRYLQVITAHALIMIFFVVVPIFFGGFANFLLPYHIGSKDVSYPRLNSFGFWMQPCGYLLVAKIGFLRTTFWVREEKIDNIFLTTEFKFHEITNILTTTSNTPINRPFRYNNKICKDLPDYEPMEIENVAELVEGLVDNTWKVFFWKNINVLAEPFTFLLTLAQDDKDHKRFYVRCQNALQTVPGWTFITPFSSDLRFSGVGTQDLLILGVYYAGISTTISICNLLSTRRNLSMPGLRTRRVLLPFISITILLMLRALSVITPILGSAMLMLLLDRHWETSFFDFSYGGDPIFFHHLFWFFGHPEVYVLIIPAFGIVNSILPLINFRRVAAKQHLIWAVYIMNYMGFLVWGHHMYLIGLDHRSRAFYSTITIMISLPATIKVVNWTFTLISGALTVNTLLLGFISFFLFFLVAGLTGMWLSHVSLNISMHDTLYVVAHFHLMLSGAVMMGIFIGFYFYFNIFFKLKYSKTLSYFHIIYYSGGQWNTFIPLFWVAFSGLPRRVHDFPAVYMGWQAVSTAGHMITMFGVIQFYSLLFESHWERKLNVYLVSLVPRFNKRILFYLAKLIQVQYILKQHYFLPKRLSRLLIINKLSNLNTN